jgi:hypothetical protein
MKRMMLTMVMAAASTAALADPLTVTAARVTRVQTYESTSNPNVWLHLNGNSRIGPNPNNAAVTCELWTNDKTVIATALAAMLADRRVDVTYVDNSSGSFWCKVQSLAIVG